MTIEPATADVPSRLRQPDTVTIISFGYPDASLGQPQSMHGSPAHPLLDKELPR